MAGVGLPLVVTVKVPATFVVKVVELPEVIEGAIPNVIGLLVALAEGPVPTLVIAATDTLYWLPLVRPVKRLGGGVELNVWLTVVPLETGVAVTL